MFDYIKITVPLMCHSCARGASVVWHLNKTKAAIFPCRPCFLKTFLKLILKLEGSRLSCFSSDLLFCFSSDIPFVLRPNLSLIGWLGQQYSCLIPVIWCIESTDHLVTWCNLSLEWKICCKLLLWWERLMDWLMESGVYWPQETRRTWMNVFSHTIETGLHSNI